MLSIFTIYKTVTVLIITVWNGADIVGYPGKFQSISCLFEPDHCLYNALPF